MSCPAIITGDSFLTRTLAHIDCQAQMLGTFGYQSLAQPGSVAATVLTGILTIFIALIGYRLLFGPGLSGRDIVSDALKIGVVLALAFSWPAYRVLLHDVVIAGPAEIAASITSQAGSGQDGFVARLQEADTAIVTLTATGTGRNSGEFLGQGPGATFAGTALQDDAAFGWSRLIYLASVIGTVGLLRLIAGLLLSLTPLAAGLLLFEATRGLFSGWLRGLVLAIVGSVGASVVLSVELALLEPWLADALRIRSLGYAAPSTPIELFALVMAFAAIHFGMIWLLTKVAFTRGWHNIGPFTIPWSSPSRELLTASPVPQAMTYENRAQRMADSVERSTEMRRFESRERTSYRTLATAGPTRNAPAKSVAESTGPSERLGASYRRTSTRRSTAAQRRERRT